MEPALAAELADALSMAVVELMEARRAPRRELV
jgi:hypothetical protein